MNPVRLVADTVVTCDEAFTVHSPGVVDVAEGRIRWVGPADDAPDHDGRTQAAGGLLMPGLVNAHAHTPMALMRGAGDGLPLLRWLTEVMWPREGRMTDDDAWWGMTVGCAEMLRAGVTTTCEMYLFEDAVIDAARAAGVRLVMTPGVLAVLHAESFGSGGGRLDAIAGVHAANHDPDGRITVGVAPHSAYDLGLERCAEVAAFARDLNALLHLHLSESQDEDAGLRAANGGRSTTALLAERGVFDGKVLAAHGVWLDADDIRICAEAGVAVAHCPVSNMMIGAGTAPVRALQAAGVTVGLGTDGPASNGNLDLWEEVKVAPLLARVSALDAAVVSATDALLMATRHGAAALGLPDVGHLSPGARADLIRIDIDHPAFAPVTHPDELVAHLAWAGADRAVTDVWVQGQALVSSGECRTIDADRALAEVRSRGIRLAEESGT